MNKKLGSYVGITGFMTLAEVVRCSQAFAQAKQKNGGPPLFWGMYLRFMVGVLVSAKTLAGGINKYPNRYPPIGRVPEIFSFDQEHILRTIHYNTDDASTLDEQVDQLMTVVPGTIDAIQLNIRWANPVKMQKIARKYPDLRIILQIGEGALADVTEPEDIYIGQALRSYGGVVTDFLVDPSGGTGKGLDVWKAFACLADGNIPANMRPGAAGGRDADNICEFKGLMRRLGYLINIDAEGRMRTPRVGDDGDHLDVDKAVRFLDASIELLSETIYEMTYRESKTLRAVS